MAEILTAKSRHYHRDEQLRRKQRDREKFEDASQQFRKIWLVFKVVRGKRRVGKQTDRHLGFIERPLRLPHCSILYLFSVRLNPTPAVETEFLLTTLCWPRSFPRHLPQNQKPNCDQKHNPKRHYRPNHSRNHI